MTKSLPAKPNIERLRNEAKSLLKAHQVHAASCCATLRNLRQFEGKPDAEILAADIHLVQVQFALAMEYGFTSWVDMVSVVARVQDKNAPPPTNPSALQQANLMREDVFTLVNQHVAEAFGKPAVYEAVHCWSTNAFCPAIFPGEDCTSWWHHAHRHCSWDLIASVLGLSVNQLRGSGLKVSPEQSSEEFEQTASRQRQEYPALMSAEMDAGGIVVIEGGWTGDGPHGFVPWVLWGMVTEAGSDGTILGATFNGHADNPIHYIDECWGLHPEAPSISAVDADLEMLRRAIARIRGGSEMFSVSGMLFGLSAMDKWIQQMREVQGFCPGCFERAPDHAWGDANDNAQTLFGGALSVSKYFRDRLGDHPAMAAHLEATAKCYDRIAEIIEPSIWKDSPVHYRTFIGDLDKQKKHADEVLRPIKRELSAAANELEKAI